MIARSIKAKILVFAVFFIGIATGIVITNFYETRVTGAPDVTNTGERALRAKRNVDRLHDYLGLSQEQREQVNKILEEMRSEVQSLREEVHPRFQSIEDEYRTKVRTVLSDDQRQKYDKFRTDREERRIRNRNADRDRSERPN